MRLLILPRYSPLGASSRLRMYQYLPALRAAGIELQVSPLLDDDYLHGLYGGRTPLAPVLRGYGRRWRALREVRDFDVVWVEKEAWPWLPLWLERWLLNGPARLVLDYDDAVFHRYDRHRNPLVRRQDEIHPHRHSLLSQLPHVASRHHRRPRRHAHRHQPRLRHSG